MHYNYTILLHKVVLTFCDLGRGEGGIIRQRRTKFTGLSVFWIVKGPSNMVSGGHFNPMLSV